MQAGKLTWNEQVDKTIKSSQSYKQRVIVNQTNAAGKAAYNERHQYIENLRTSELKFWIIPIMYPWNERRLGAGDYASVVSRFHWDFYYCLELTWLKFSPPHS